MQLDVHYITAVIPIALTAIGSCIATLAVVKYKQSDLEKKVDNHTRQLGELDGKYGRECADLKGDINGVAKKFGGIAHHIQWDVAQLYEFTKAPRVKYPDQSYP